MSGGLPPPVTTASAARYGFTSVWSEMPSSLTWKQRTVSTGRGGARPSQLCVCVCVFGEVYLVALSRDEFALQERLGAVRVAVGEPGAHVVRQGHVRLRHQGLLHGGRAGRCGVPLRVPNVQLAARCAAGGSQSPQATAAGQRRRGPCICSERTHSAEPMAEPRRRGVGRWSRRKLPSIESTPPTYRPTHTARLYLLRRILKTL